MTSTTPGEPATKPTMAPPMSGVEERGLKPWQVTLPTTTKDTLAEVRRGKRVPNEVLEERLTNRLDTVNRYLTEPRLLEKLSNSSLKEIGTYEGLLLTHLSHLRGKAGAPSLDGDNRKLNELVPMILNEMKQRGLTAKFTERTATLEAK